MRKKIMLAAVLSSVVLLANAQQKHLTSYVNPYIGSEGHGHVFVGANVPFGAVQLGPTQIGQSWDKFNGWDWCSGYNYVSQEILGFTHTHLSGTGIGDLNDVMMVPATGALQLSPMKFNHQESGYGSFFKKTSEIVKPGFYAVHLDKYNVDAELTSTARVGVHHYHYNTTDSAHLLVDLGFQMNWDRPTDTYIRQVNDSTFVGYRFSTGWAKRQRLFFAIKTSLPITTTKLFDSATYVSGNAVKSLHAKAALYFNAQKNPDITVRVGISPVSEENALGNIAAEAPSNDFATYQKKADQAWEKALSAVDFEGSALHDTLFYTSLYHMYFGPSLFNDANKDYRGTDDAIYKKADFDNYTTMSLWDIYRGWAPFMTISQPNVIRNTVKAMLAIYQQQGRLHVWPLVGSETDCMVGNPAIPIITDAFCKGLIDKQDVALAYEAVRNTAMRDSMGLQYVQKLQYIPADSMHESVAWAMEFAIADAGIARMAKLLEKKDDAAYFTKRSQLYKLYYDKEKGFFNGHFANGSFRRPFDPVYSAPEISDFTEGNAWQYLWLVPQDVHGLIQLLGGEKTFTKRLDQLFAMSSQLSATTAPDVSGLIGQYAQGNEPSHHVAYLYNYVGQPWKTADLVRKVVDSFYTTKPDGLCGNEDVGQMSAWYVFSSLGMYSVNPTEGKYVFGSPLMDKATLHLENGQTFTIEAKYNSATNKYIQRIELNGKAYPYTYIWHATIVKGGKLTFYMGSKPSKTYGVAAAARP